MYLDASVSIICDIDEIQGRHRQIVVTTTDNSLSHWPSL